MHRIHFNSRYNTLAIELVLVRITYFTNSVTTKNCWYCPDTDTDTRIGAALVAAKSS